MRLVVDTNIIFSAILNQKSRIGKILISQQKYFELFSCYFLQEELKKHYQKISQITKKPIDWVVDMERSVTKNIKFIDEKIIPVQLLKDSENLVKDVDGDDVLFVALTKHLKGILWTGDKALIKHLMVMGFEDIVTTQELFIYIEERER